MHTTVNRLKILLLLIGAFIYSVNGCLTWNVDGNSIKFICRIRNSSTVNLVDHYGQYVARCAIIGSSGNCSSSSFVKSTIQENVATFNIDRNRKADVNGKWSCLQQDNIFTTEVLTSKDITDSTTVNLFGKIFQDKDVHRILLTCSSCRIPKGKNAEFLMNNSSVDLITFDDDTGKCTHLHGECIADECNCGPSGNTFARMFVLKRPLKTATYFSCDLRFEDKAKSVVFSKVPTVSFNGIEFENRGTRTVITKLTYDHNRPKDKDKGNETVNVVIAVLSASASLAIIVAVGASLYWKKKRRKKKKSTDEVLPFIERKSEKKQRNGADTPFIEMTDKTVQVHIEEPIQFNDSLRCVIPGDESNPILETYDKSFQVNFEEDRLLPGRSLQDVERIQEPAVIIETYDKNFQVNFEEDRLLPGRSLQDVERIQEPAIIETNDKSFIINVEEDILPHDRVLQDVEQIQESDFITENDEKSDHQQKSFTNTEIHERVLTTLSIDISLGRPAHPAEAKLDVIFMNCDSLIELKWVLTAAEVLENEYDLHCGIPGIDTESFKCVSETSKVIITFSEISARIPDALKMAEFLPQVVIVMVEECSIPIQLTNMKCVDATKDKHIWLNQLLIALKLRNP